MAMPSKQEAILSPAKEEHGMLQTLKEIVSYGIMAPSSHNTQCWQFQIQLSSSDNKEVKIVVTPDKSRRCPVVDPDDHHVYATLGCAVENMVIAAQAKGFVTPQVTIDEKNETIMVSFSPSPTNKDSSAPPSQLFQAIARRQCTRSTYSGEILTEEELELLQKAGTGNGVNVMLLTDKKDMEKVSHFIQMANTAQMKDKAFIQELKEHIRFSRSEAKLSGDGLFSGSTGNPSAPRWLGGFLFDHIVSASSENAKIRQQIHSSAGIAIFYSETNDLVLWIEAGRCYERFALQATAIDVQNAFLNQPVEVGAIRPEFAEALGLGRGSRPDLVVRFGKGGDKLPRSQRRPMESVIRVVVRE